MNTKNNKRKRDFIQKNRSGFDICKKANLNRSTFYANFIDIYELADTISEKLEAQVSELYKDEITQGFNSNNYLVLFQHIKENQTFYRTYFKLGYDEKITIFQYDYELAQKHFDD